jgi:hypothetical protein
VGRPSTGLGGDLENTAPNDLRNQSIAARERDIHDANILKIEWLK